MRLLHDWEAASLGKPIRRFSPSRASLLMMMGPCNTSRRLQLSFFIAGAITCLTFVTYLFRGEHVRGARINVRHSPAPFNASLGFGKVLLISLPT